MSNRDIEKVAYRVAELTRGVEGLTRARQVARSIVSGKELDDLVKDAESAQDRLDTQDELINEIGDAADWWVPSAELTADAADEAHEAKMQALESLSDAIAALDGIENLEEELTIEIAAAQAAADAAATEANLAKLQALQNLEDILTLSNEQAVIADEARDAWNAAVQAGQDAATAAGIAAGKGKTIIQSATPSEEDRLAQNLWIDTTDGANTPKRWTGSTWVAVSDKVAVDAAATAVAAQSAADAAAAAAASAGDAATEALTTANGKTKLFRSTAAASGQGSTVGDVWWRFGNAQFTGPVIGQWTWSGSTWVPNTIGSQVIEALTVDKLSVTGGAKIPTAVIDTLVGDQAFFDAVLANRIVVAGNNLVWDSTYRGWNSPAFSEPTGGPGTGFVTDVVRPGMTVSQKLTQRTGAQSTQSLYSATRGQVNISNNVNTDRLIYVGDRAGEKLVAYAHWFVDKSVSNSDGLGISTQVYFYNKAGQNFSNQNGGRIPFTQVPVGEWFKVGGTQLTVPEGALYAQVRPTVYFTNNTAPSNTAAFYLGGEEAYWGVGAVLIEDGAVTAPKITASEALSAKVAEFIKVKASQLVADSAAMNAAFIGQLVSDAAFLASLYTNRVIVDSTDLAPGPGGYQSAWTLGANASHVPNDSLDMTGVGTEINTTGGSTAARSVYGPTMPVTAGVSLLVNLRGTWRGTSNTGRWSASMEWFDSSGAAAGKTTVHDVSANETISKPVVVPNGAAFARLVLWAAANSEPGNRVFRNISVRPQVGAVLIEDGAVTADKLRADAIDGKTITGATIRTAASGQRLVLDSSFLRGYGASGALTGRVAPYEEGSGGTVDRRGIAIGTAANLNALVVEQEATGPSAGSVGIVSTEHHQFDKSVMFYGRMTRYMDSGWTNFTRASGMAGTAQWRRYLGIIYVRMNITTSVATGDHVQLGTLPADARPAQPTPLSASGTGGPICAAYVDTAGVIRFRNANNHTATAPYVYGSFLAKDIL